MNIFQSLQFQQGGPRCQNCAHFQSDPAAIEATYPGLTTMSSGYASVRDRDGLCNYHQIYLSGRDSCECFVGGVVETVIQNGCHPEALEG